MSLSVTLLFMLCTLVDAIVAGFFYSYLLHAKYKSKTTLFLLCVIIFGAQALLLPYAFKPIRSIVIVLLALSFVLLFYTDRIWRKLLIFLVSGGLTILSEILIDPLLYLLKIDFNDVLIQANLMAFFVSCSIVVLSLLHFVGAIFLKKLLLRETIPTRISYLLPFLASQTVIGLVIINAFSKNLTLPNALMFLFFILMFLISDVYIYRILRTISQQAQQAELLKSLEQQMKNQYDYYRAQLHSFEDIRAIRHDVKNQIQTAYALLAQQHTEEAQSLLDRLTQHVQSAEIPFFCENEIVNALLFNKYNQMKDLNISFSHSIALDNRFFLDDAILCSLFANTLDNAINACSAINDPQTDKRINIKAGMRNEHFILRVENSFTGEIHIEDGVPVSAKKDGHSGYGSQILAMIAKRCNGSVEYKIEDESFAVAVLLPAMGKLNII